MSGNKSKIIAFNYFGGKFSWIEHLNYHFPDPSLFNHLCELFGGSCAVSLNYKGKVIKTVNEINEDITNFFEVLRDNEQELMRLLLLTPCSNLEYDRCWEPSQNKIEQARRFYVRVRQSFFGLGCSRKNKGWHMAKSQNNAKGGETVSKWNNALEKLHEVAEAIRTNIQITNFSFEVAIGKIDSQKTFFYADPPYPEECRASFNDYKFEFSTEDHITLSEKLHSINGLAMISSYNTKLYNDLYSDWRKVELPIKKNNIRSSEVQEVIWMNYPEQKIGLFNNY
ncbi:DNA adenine methylase [Arcicella sp. DC2W]|uniref:DNA adenine methylase n=1 Tax=Arcicella gelida TaxID=2984195 RepID=A0ABU5S2E9_9BACT|nr:DNA adenine methylase [Arcicella sp. DC2W]MEA5402652.1 DNA adenine methylase [Arcicella sp. DC2W]